MNEIIEKENIIVEDMIYEIRGVQVMLSSDVAKLYQVDTKVLNQTIKRNINRFPEEFCFQLTKEEWRVLNLKSQIVTSSLNNNYGGVRYLPYVLTEHGIMMLAGLLKSDVAIKISIYIIKAFVKMRQYINYNKEILPNKIMLLENKVDDNTKRINELSSRSQFATLNKSNNLRGYNIKYLPYVLTEQGIMMLSGLLKSDVAVKVNIQIIDAFVKMKRYFANNISNSELLLNHENRLLRLEKSFDKFNEKEINKIFFEGELYDAYSLLLDILNKSKKEIIIIDNYAGKELLDILKKINRKIIIVSKNIDDILIKKYESQYKNIIFINNNSFHDRFIIIDRKTLYICGASFKDLGKKCFYIGEFSDIEYLNKLLSIINL